MSPRPSQGGGWTLYPDAALRMAGFPFSWWESLLPAGLLAGLSPLEDAWVAGHAHRAHLLRAAFPAAVRATEDRVVLRTLSRARAAVGKLRPVADAVAPELIRDELRAWNDRMRALAEATDALQESFGAELLLLRSRLHEVAGRESLREAVGLLSPSVAESLDRYADDPLPAQATSRDRGLEHRIVLYLQRLVAKNETNSFFGPVGAACVDAAAVPALRVLGEFGCGPPVVFSSPRLARGIAALLAVDPKLGRYVPLRRSPMLELTGDRLTHQLTGRSVRLSPAEVSAWRAAAAPGEVGKAVPDRLIRLGALTRQVPVDLWSAEPLDSLEDWLLRLPPVCATQTWLRRVDELRAGIRSFAEATGRGRRAALAGLERRAAELTGGRQRQGAGRMYTDRSVVFEERENRISLALGGALADGLAGQLAPALTYWAATASERWAQHQRVAAELFDRSWPGHDEVPLPAYLAAAAALPPVSTPTAAEIYVAGLVEATTAEIRLPAERLEALATAIHGPVFSSVDLLVAATDERAVADGALRWVLGEAHAGHLLSVFPTDHFVRSRDRGASHRRDTWLFHALQRTGRRAAWLVTGRDTKIYQYQQPAVAVQLRPYLPEHSARSASELTVRRLREGVELCDFAGPLWLLPAVRTATDGFDPLAPLSFPAVQTVPFGRSALRPRVLVGDTVVQRAGWRVPAAPLARLQGAKQFLAARSFRRECGMPELVFVQLPWEPKPTLLDFRNPLSVGAFAGLLRHDPAVSGDTVLTFSEMLPGPADLWLGERTFELRLLAVWEGGECSAADIG
ncbi:MAG TPA: hypothetical protein VHY21_03800 [Pseudonocardiaceae bacterium]|jgi:hypothetical protein|nr:hypothetical protein [Pseudonocardiaceae bacterium]